VALVVLRQNKLYPYIWYADFLDFEILTQFYNPVVVVQNYFSRYQYIKNPATLIL